MRVCWWDVSNKQSIRSVKLVCIGNKWDSVYIVVMPTPRQYFLFFSFSFFTFSSHEINFKIFFFFFFSFFITWHLIRTKDSARLLFSAASGRLFTVGELRRAEKISERHGNLVRSSVTSQGYTTTFKLFLRFISIRRKPKSLFNKCCLRNAEAQT